MRWQEGVRQHRAQRCLLSVYVSVLVCVALLVAMSITAVWVPSAVLANDELAQASEGQLLSSVEQVSKELLGYFQVASSQAEVIGNMYNMSFAAAPAAAPRFFIDTFGAGAWSLLNQAPSLQSVLLAQARDDLLLNSTSQACNTDVALLSATYKANLNYETTGTGWTGNESLLKLEASDEAPAGQARMNLIWGDDNLADPLKFNGTLFFKNCDAWLGGGESLWSMQNLPGDWSRKDSGIREAVWLPGTVIAGSGTSQALYKKVDLQFFPLMGPSWAPESAFGAISVRVGASAIVDDADSTVSVQDILQQVAEQTEMDTLLFILTAEGELLATSSGDQPVEVRGTDGLLVGLMPGDFRGSAHEGGEAAHREPLQRRRRRRPAVRLVRRGLDAGDIWVLRVRQVDVRPEGREPQHGAGQYGECGCREGGVPGELNLQLGITSAIILAFACVLALVLSRVVSTPFRAARDSMFLLGDMRVEDALQRNSETKRTCRWSFTEVSDLRLSFFHAATCLQAWREHEMDRRVQLEEERTSRIHKTVEKAVRGAGKLVHPMVLISADAFSKLEQLTSYEELRNTRKLVFLDTEEALAMFKADNSIIFLSHQWLAWGFPDNATKTHLNAMKRAIKTASARVGAKGAGSRCAWENTYVWVDYCSIAQDHRGMQMLAVSSLPVYSASADIFVIIAPPAEHQSSRRCDLQSYNARGWCRAEMLAKICSSGLENFFIFASGEGDLEPVTEDTLPSLSMFVFEGEFSCCQQRHIKSSCDKEALVEPVLGLYSLVLRQIRANVNCKNMEPIMKHIRDNKERFFPTLYSFQAEGVGAEERELFGPLVGATEAYVEELSLPECTVSFHSWQRPGGEPRLSRPCLFGRFLKFESPRFSDAFVRHAGNTCPYPMQPGDSGSLH
ncbi:unnamed protein product [Prorocentrum cordatum]|uniref:Protein xylosyltransferase n=1 Tax=Prorocentrum cordatum TaxID=2364126 RepID=A0ABN9W862_9DINO|nr:unnamed protein product [Polarella glacialis]